MQDYLQEPGKSHSVENVLEEISLLHLEVLKRYIAIGRLFGKSMKTNLVHDFQELAILKNIWGTNLN